MPLNGNQKSRLEQEILMNYRLAYRKSAYVNWCEALGTMANDEIKAVYPNEADILLRKSYVAMGSANTAYAGVSKRHGNPGMV